MKKQRYRNGAHNLIVTTQAVNGVVSVKLDDGESVKMDFRLRPEDAVSFCEQISGEARIASTLARGNRSNHFPG